MTESTRGPEGGAGARPAALGEATRTRPDRAYFRRRPPSEMDKGEGVGRPKARDRRDADHGRREPPARGRRQRRGRRGEGAGRRGIGPECEPQRRPDP